MSLANSMYPRAVDDLEIVSPLPKMNTPDERNPIASTANMNLQGLSKHGKKVEKHLYEGLESGRHPSLVGDERVRDTWFRKGHTEAKRNREHEAVDKYTEKARRLLPSESYKTRKVTEKLDRALTQKARYQNKLRNIAIDSEILKEHGYIGEKDQRRINYPIYKKTRELGYTSDENSPHHSSGYKRKPSEAASSSASARPGSPSGQSEFKRPRILSPDSASRKSPGSTRH